VGSTDANAEVTPPAYRLVPTTPLRTSADIGSR
jgi:hypothetical protein